MQMSFESEIALSDADEHPAITADRMRELRKEVGHLVSRVKSLAGKHLDFDVDPSAFTAQLRAKDIGQAENA